MRDKIKRRSAIFSLLKKQYADVIVLVETHAEGRIQKALKRPWIGWVYHSVHTTHSRGVSVLISKATHFELDPLGRYVFLDATIYGDPILILAFYVPEPLNSTILAEGFSVMALHPSIPAIWLVDFNIILNTSLDKIDRTPPTQPPPRNTRFARLIADFNLVDTWRSTNPTTRVLLFLPLASLNVQNRLYSHFPIILTQIEGYGLLPKVTL